jgi:DNA (cytosine-5)-methyltransferase 1
MDKLTKTELIKKCKEFNLKNYNLLNKQELIELINKNKKFILIDLFAGTGAFSYAFHKTNKVETIYANDILKYSKEIYDVNNKNICLTLNDLNDVNINNIPNCNIITAGFPCQPFSIAGMQKGFNDERSNIFWKILEIIKIKQPDIVILENVKNLQSHDKGKTFNIIIENITKLNYFVKYKVLNTYKITHIPHNRERIYIIAFRNKKIYDTFNFDFPNVKNKNITDFLETNILDKYYYTDKSIIYDKLKESVTKNISTNTIYQYRRYYVRENKNNVCPTLTCNMGTGGHNVPLLMDDKGIRKLTPRECFNLQGFPNDYILPNLSSNKLYSLAGNSVSIDVVSLIANRIVSLL